MRTREYVIYILRMCLLNKYGIYQTDVSKIEENTRQVRLTKEDCISANASHLYSCALDYSNNLNNSVNYYTIHFLDALRIECEKESFEETSGPSVAFHFYSYTLLFSVLMFVFILTFYIRSKLKNT